MRLSLIDNLPFVHVRVAFAGQTAEVSNVLLDTGSGATIFAADIMLTIGISPAPDDPLYTVRGVGGAEAVFLRKIDYLEVGNLRLDNFEIEIGAMDYGFAINGILGMDFLHRAGAIIDLRRMELEFGRKGGESRAQ